MVLIEDKQKTAKKSIKKDQKKTFTKKEYLIKILDALMNKRPLAKWLKKLVESNKIDNKTIDSLIEIFRKVIKNVTNKIKKDKFVKWMSILEKVKQHEIQITQNEKENVDQLLNNI